VAGSPSGENGLGRAAGTVDIRRLRIDPEPERDADRLLAGAQERNRAVDTAAHRDRDALGVRGGAEDRPECVRERVDRELVASDRRRLEQGQPLERPVEPLGVGADDPVTVDREPNQAPLAAAR
jgi:hypothetical protein